MKTIEIFSGTKSFSKVAEELGHSIFTIDNKKELNPDKCIDFLELSIIDFINEEWDVCWASPPCTTFSVASIGKHWKGGLISYAPKTEEAEIGLLLLNRTIKWISIVRPKIWFIENPRGMMRKVIDRLFEKHNITDYKRITVWYCQYGDNRAKPTDIWTNLKNWEGRQCHNGNKNCHHQPAPRGSKTGTQGLRNARIRGIIPKKLFYELFDIINKGEKDERKLRTNNK